MLGIAYPFEPRFISIPEQCLQEPMITPLLSHFEILRFFLNCITCIYVLISTIIICSDIDWKTSNEPRMETKGTQFELTCYLTSASRLKWVSLVTRPFHGYTFFCLVLWPWCLAYLLKTLTLTKSLKWKILWLWHFTSIFLGTKPFRGDQTL
jgi:hypothetical protein